MGICIVSSVNAKISQWVRIELALSELLYKHTSIYTNIFSIYDLHGSILDQKILILNTRNCPVIEHILKHFIGTAIFSFREISLKVSWQWKKTCYEKKI
jgi:hypothetical protein